MNRPLLWALLSLIFVLLFTAFALPFWILIIYVIIIASLPLIFHQIPKSWIFITLIIIIIGFFVGVHAFQSENIFHNVFEKNLRIVGIVDDLPVEKENTTAFVLKTETIDRQKINGKLQVSISHYGTSCDVHPAVGDCVAFSGCIEMPESNRNPGGLNYALYLKSKGISGIVYLKNNTAIDVRSQNSSVKHHLLSIRAALESVIDENSSPEQADVINGILFGEKNISDDVKSQFSDAGISHVLAVSGLHIGYIFLLIAAIFNLFRFKGKKKILLFTALLLFYLTLIGFPASAVRAAIMLMVIVITKEMHEAGDALSGLCFAAILILIVNPAELFQAGFQLSFGATLSIILFNRPVLHLIEKRTDKVGKISEALSVTLCALVGTLPAMIYHYHQINLISILSGIVIVPIVGVLFISAWLAIPFLAIFSGSALFRFIPQTLAQLILDVSSLLSQLKGLTFNGTQPGFFGFILFFLIIFTVTGYLYVKKKHQKYPSEDQGTRGEGRGTNAMQSPSALSALVSNKMTMLNFVFSQHRALILIFAYVICISGIILTILWPKPLTVTFLDVGQGDCAVIRTPNGGAYMIDGGGYENFDDTEQITRKSISEKVLLPALYSMGITDLDGVFITHNHSDHAQGIEELLQCMPIRQIYLSSKDNNLTLQQQKQIPIHFLGRGDTLKTEDGVQINVFSPDKKIENLPDELQNQSSLVLQLCYGQIRFLFAADIDASVESSLTAFDQLESTVLKVAHHGSSTATSADFLAHVKPKIAVISVGKNNIHGHPTKEVLDRLHDQDIEIFRTDRNGAVVFKTNGKSINTHSYLQE